MALLRPAMRLLPQAARPGMLRLAATPALSLVRHKSEAVETPSSDLQKSSAKYLVSLKEQELDGKISAEEADREADNWLEAMAELRKDFEAQGGFSPSKAFAPEDNPDFKFFRDTPKDAVRKFEPTAQQLAEYVAIKDKPLPGRNDTTIEYLTKLIMRHGLKARAQKYMSQALYLVYLKTRKDPVAQVKDILERMAPVVKLKRYTDGGARAELVPVPLTETQRLRQSWMWILESSRKRPSKDFSVRLAEELVSAIQGKSPGFEKKVQQHKLAIVNRAYVNMVKRRR